MKLTLDRLKQCVSYDPETGIFTRLQCGNSGVRYIGKATGKKASNGYVQIQIDHVRYLAHRLAWMYVTGEWPTLEIDHIDGSRCRNALSNLRQVDRRTNCENQRRSRPGASCQLLGVSIERGLWRADIKTGATRKFLGRFKSPEAAQAAYFEAKRLLHPGCTI